MDPNMEKLLASLMDTLNSIQKSHDGLLKAIEQLQASGRKFMATDVNLASRISAIDKYLSTALPQTLEAQKKMIMFSADYVNSLLISQGYLFHHLTKEGVIKREEVGLFLDSIIKDLSEKQPNNPHAVQYLKNLRENINKAAPYQYPDWLQDMMGNDKNETDPKDPKKE